MTCPHCDPLGALSEPHDAHVQLAHRLMRDVGFTLAALQYPRSPRALAELRRRNGMPDHIVEPVGWRYWPNAWCRDRGE